ncbi:MAG TPA: hypothetical protein VF585_08745 [Chthoniobacterales bacterium]|jgi:hypothetical protein
MALHINLLHEEQSKVVERKRDPLKLGILAMLVVSVFLYGYYLLEAKKGSDIASERATVEAKLAEITPTAAQAKIDETKAVQAIAATTAIEKIIDERFYWGQLFKEIVGGTGPEVQLTSFEGAIRTPEALSITIVGVSAGREPRAVAERFRQSMEERLAKTYGTATSQFASLENSDTPLVLAGKNFATANFSIAFQITLKAK